MDISQYIKDMFIVFIRSQCVNIPNCIPRQVSKVSHCLKVFENGNRQRDSVEQRAGFDSWKLEMVENRHFGGPRYIFSRFDL